MDITVPVPDGQKGNWKVESFEVSEQEASLHNIRCAVKPGMGRRRCSPGKYKKLTRNGYIVMSNTPAEIDDHRYFIYRAEGDVLINGLGLGVCVFGLLKRDRIDSITVIEISSEVIDLVAPYIKDDRVTIINADALEYKSPKGKRYHSVWHDIWDDICADNLPDMHKLHRKYGRRTYWQGSWCRGLCEMYR